MEVIKKKTHICFAGSKVKIYSFVQITSQSDLLQGSSAAEELSCTSYRKENELLQQCPFTRLQQQSQTLLAEITAEGMSESVIFVAIQAWKG